MDESIRLKKLCAAKDAQIEALYGRVEILTDDIAVLRGERAYLHEAAQSSKRECHTYEMRARRFDQDARAATLRADEAERALIASECSFAKDLDALRTLLRTSDDAQHQAANTDVETVSLISQIETLRAELRALDEASPYTARLAAAEASAATAAAQEQASAARAAAAVLVEENASLRVQLQEAVRRQEALQRQLDAREELARITAERLQLAARREVEQDELIDRPEEDLTNLSKTEVLLRRRLEGGGAHGGASVSGDGGARGDDAKAASLLEDGYAAEEAAAGQVAREAAPAAAAAAAAVAAAVHSMTPAAAVVTPRHAAPNESHESAREQVSAARMRWLQELTSHTTPSPCNPLAQPPPPLPGLLSARDSARPSRVVHDCGARDSARASHIVHDCDGAPPSSVNRGDGSAPPQLFCLPESYSAASTYAPSAYARELQIEGGLRARAADRGRSGEIESYARELQSYSSQGGSRAQGLREELQPCHTLPHAMTGGDAMADFLAAASATGLTTGSTGYVKAARLRAGEGRLALAQEKGAAQESRSYPAHLFVQTTAERRTREQIKALLIAKETALSAVAAL